MSQENMRKYVTPGIFLDPMLVDTGLSVNGKVHFEPVTDGESRRRVLVPIVECLRSDLEKRSHLLDLLEAALATPGISERDRNLYASTVELLRLEEPIRSGLQTALETMRG